MAAEAVVVAVAVAVEPIDRVGLGWRPALAAGIFAHLDEIDVLEVLAEGLFHAPNRQLRALETLALYRPVYLHGVSMGLATTQCASTDQMARMARLVEKVKPEGWSEHLAFVRGGGYEIGHMAAPPRTERNIAGALRNISAARQTVGALPVLENVATLVMPPASSLAEPEWASEIIRQSGATMLLDLHNLYANALNFGEVPETCLALFPLERVSMVHLSGGCWIGEPGNTRKQRLLDDHLHDPPDAVYGLLARLAEWTPKPLTVLIERDGNFPSMEQLLAQIREVRRALRLGREARSRNLPKGQAA